MAYKIAIASSDEKTVNQHFGTADKFVIYEINEDSKSLIEIRNNEPYCKGHVHDATGVNTTVELLKDVKYVFVSKIGMGPALILQDKGIEAVESDQTIEEVLNGLTNG